LNKWKKAIRTRYYWSIILGILGILLIIVHILIPFESIKSIITCVGTSFMSAAITIFLVKFDIMDLIQNNIMEKYGIIDIVHGRDAVFVNDEIEKIKTNSWEDFLRNSSDNTVDIVGISMYSFLITKDILHILYELSENFVIRIVFANPSSQEVAYQSLEEEKPDKLQENIKWISEKILAECKNIHIFYSKTMPRAFIVRSGNKMIITPYLLDGPFKEPTIIASDQGFVENSYYDTYKRYIEKIISSAEKLKQEQQ